MTTVTLGEVHDCVMTPARAKREEFKRERRMLAQHAPSGAQNEQMSLSERACRAVDGHRGSRTAMSGDKSKGSCGSAHANLAEILRSPEHADQ